ncbi:hypothetical protein WA026_009036 [Henosepilachna vigintioctopunctata]|uniref:Uncharacterized protein n=1 Tax=Henosepilachna vigintioctopunctata TaxID=420089 RepID=A0AAW1UWD4_9CUCU
MPPDAVDEWSNKLKPFWLSITEKESLPVLDFLSAALMSAEYDRALSRALAMTECPVVPFFGAYLRELREILSAPLSGHGDQGDQQHHHHSSTSNKPPKSESRRDQMQQQRQVFISDYNGEHQYLMKFGPCTFFTLEEFYRTQAVMDHISSCFRHYHTRNRLSPSSSLIDYLK